MATLAENIRGLMEKVPGYAGYSEKENRRTADKELRAAIAAAYESQVTRISRLQERLINQGDFATTERLDDVISRLQHLVDRIKTASYGYSPLFERTDVIDEIALDRLYAFDLQMANGIDGLGALINDLSENRNVAQVAEDLFARVDELHQTFDMRAHIISTFPAGGSQSAPASPTPPQDATERPSDAPPGGR